MENFGIRQAAQVIVICFIWASNLLVMKIVFEGISPVCASGLRFGIGAISLIAWAVYKKMDFRVARRHWLGLVVIGVSGAAIYVFFANGLDRTTVQRASILIYSHPLITAIFAHFVFPDDRLTPRKTTGLLISFGGVAVVFAHGISVGDTSYLLGDVLVFAGALCWAFFTICTKKMNEFVDPLMVILYELIITAPLLLVIAGGMGENMVTTLNLPIVASLMYAGVISTVAFVSWNGLLKIYPATALCSFIYLCPIFGVALGGFFRHEGFDPNLILALVLVAIGIRVVNTTPKIPAQTSDI